MSMFLVTANVPFLILHGFIQLAPWASWAAIVLALMNGTAGIFMLFLTFRIRTYTVVIQHTSGLQINVTRVSLYKYTWPYLLKMIFM